MHRESVEPAAQERELRAYYHTLFGAWGCQHWWPARTRFEVIAGAYLTQNTSWRNVERALRRLRAAGLLSIAGIRAVPLPKLEEMIRSSGYFRQKARRLKTFVAFLDENYGRSLDRMFAQPTARLREELLGLDGVGRETADSILLYAGQHPVFVVDAYTRRILERHAIMPAKAPYEEVRGLWERALAAVPPRGHSVTKLRTDNRRPGTGVHCCHPPSRMSQAHRSSLAQAYNDMHGLIVGLGKNYCLKSKPRCDDCPLQKFLPNSE